MNLLFAFLLIMTPQLNAQMKMSVDPKTSKIRYDVLGNVTKDQGNVFKQSIGEALSLTCPITFDVICIT